MIIFRYLCKEFYATLLVISVVVLFIFISNQFVHYLNDAATGRITMLAVMKIMMLQIPLLLGYLIPLAVYLSILLVLGRMYMEHEITILLACGMSKIRLLSMVMSFTTLMMIVVAFLMLGLEPIIEQYRTLAIDEAVSIASVQKIIPSRFHDLGQGSVFYASSVDRTNSTVSDVFFATRKTQSAKSDWDVTISNTANEKAIPPFTGHFVVFNDGHRYIGHAGSPVFEAVDYSHYGARLMRQSQASMSWPNGASTLDLWQKRSDPRASSVLQWRLGMPISVMIFGLLAFPLSKANARQGKFAKLVPAILLYIAYADLMFLGKAWIDKGTISPMLGLWWIHGVFLLIALLLNIQFLRSRSL